MKKEIIKIQKISQAIPKKKTWYKYFDDVFISVICSEGRKSHIRRKGSSEYNFIDNKMCFWHCHWQYDLIESFYGNQEKEIKTYEKVIFFKEEKHIVDSVVDKYGIEFQHTLSVSIEEMDSRFLAQKNNNYNPFLVLDFTDYSIPDFFMNEYVYYFDSFKILLENIEDNISKKIIKKLLKWSKSKYFLNGSLFIDFNNGIVRFNKDLLIGNIVYSKKEFVESLFDLNNILENKLKLDNVTRKNRQNKLKELQKLQEKENIKKNLEKLQAIREEEEKLEKEAKEKLIRNNSAKEKSVDFDYFRIVIKEKKINKHFNDIDFYSSIFRYSTYSENIDNILIKHYLYYSIDENLLIIYSNTGLIENNKYNFISSEIKILKKVNKEVIRSYSYKKDRGEKLKIIEYKSEIAIGYYHSLDSFAYVKYDSDEKPIFREYYIFNKKIKADFFKDTSTVVNIGQGGYEYLIQVEKKSKEDLENLEQSLCLIHSNDDKFREDILCRYGISPNRLKEYYRFEGIEFKNYLLEEFFILDY